MVVGYFLILIKHYSDEVTEPTRYQEIERNIRYSSPKTSIEKENHASYKDVNQARKQSEASSVKNFLNYAQGYQGPLNNKESLCCICLCEKNNKGNISAANQKENTNVV